jgi:hypothetical protein
MPVVGHARINGKDHPDWEKRERCKKCFKKHQDFLMLVEILNDKR